MNPQEEIEVAWAAGLFEGEGSVSAWRLQLKMVAEESVRRFHAAVGCGQVYGPYGPYESSLGTQPFYLWVATQTADRARVVELLVAHASPWLRDLLLIVVTTDGGGRR